MFGMRTEKGREPDREMARLARKPAALYSPAVRFNEFILLKELDRGLTKHLASSFLWE